MKKKLHFIVGIAISTVFIILAFYQVRLSELVDSIKTASISYVLIVLFFVIFSAYLRALRWYYFLLPQKKIDINSLFSSLLIGYGANVILPAHLGEIVRAFVLGKKKKLAVSSTLATILVERVIDILTFLFLLIFLLLIYDFPKWVKESAIALFVVALLLIVMIIFIRIKTNATIKLINHLLKPAPLKFREKINHLIETFAAGFVGLNKKSHYVVTFLLSIAIWLGYVFGFAFGLKAFHLHLPWIAPLVLMVITTISIVVPSSPGYIGTYHWLCQLALGFFGVGKSEALGFALVIHALNTLPFLILGLICAWKEGVNIFQFSRNRPALAPKQAVN
ncbi:MAG: flippase-like domain-containing protein [Calditrichaeota bacterium]|nr:flippase-like domain-containing protein [Calditrichota bacterium]